MNASNATYSVIVTGEPMCRFQGQVEKGRENSIAFTVTLDLVVANPRVNGRKHNETAKPQKHCTRIMRPSEFTELEYICAWLPLLKDYIRYSI